MYLSEDTVKVLEYLKNYSDNSLRKANDIGIILELGAVSGDSDLINKIIFSGKSIWNLHRTIQKQINSSNSNENVNQLQLELMNSISEIQNYIELLTRMTEELVAKRFVEVYLQDKRGSYLNIIDLSHDLAIFKQLQTDMLQNK